MFGPEKKHFYPDGYEKHRYTIGMVARHRIHEQKIDDYYWKWTWMYFHEFYEIFLSKSDCSMFVNDKIYHVASNDLLIFNTTDFHRTVVPEGQLYDRYNVIFDVDYMTPYSTPTTDLTACFTSRGEDFYHIRHLTDEQSEKFQRWFEKIMEYSNSPQYGDDVRKRLILAEMLIEVNNLFQQQEHAVSHSVPSKYAKVKPILDYINANFQENLSIDMLAKKFFISKYHMCREFRELTDHSINEYITFRRMLRAAELLRSGQSITQTALQVGINNYSYFITTFKRIIGLTPKKYVQKYRDISPELPP